METSELLAKLVGIDSRYPNERNLADYVYAFFKKRGVRIFRQNVERGRENIIVEKGSGKNTIALYSHLDTVGVADGWSTNPFSLHLKNDKAYGLGAFDMKGGMTANIQTFLQYEPKNITLRLFFCVDEENISKGANVLIQSRFVKNLKCVVSTEPAFMHGINGVVTGRIGRAVFEIILKREPTHYMFYKPASDISLLSAKIVIKLQKMYHTKRDRKQFAFVRIINSEVNGLSTPHKIYIEVDTAILPPITNERMLQEIKDIVYSESKKCDEKVVTSVDYKKRQTPFLSGYEINKNNMFLSILENSVKEVTGDSARRYFRSSVADENIFGAAGIPTLGIGPVGGNAHSKNEWVSLSSIEKLKQIMNNFLSNYDLGRS